MCHVPDGVRYAIPPYMFSQLKLRAPETVQLAATDTITRSDAQREERFAMQSELAAGARSRPAAAISPPDQVLRRVYDADGGGWLPGTLKRSNGDPATGDAAVDEAYAGAGYTYFFFRDVLDRNSIDHRGLSIDSTVHYGRRYNNAFWNGSQMVYGDGDEELFTRFTADLDIIAHELSHGVVQYEANLDYQYQSGALHESFADVLGQMVKQWTHGRDVRTANWLIGDKVLIGDQYALRSMKAPGTAYQNHPIFGDDPQPATMDDYNDLSFFEDRGGVHINSGIPNYAFYVAAMEMGGSCWERIGRIWYVALCDRLRRDADFIGGAHVLMQVARDEYGEGSLELKAVEKGWKEAKVI